MYEFSNWRELAILDNDDDDNDDNNNDDGGDDDNGDDNGDDIHDRWWWWWGMMVMMIWWCSLAMSQISHRSECASHDGSRDANWCEIEFDDVEELSSWKWVALLDSGLISKDSIIQ